MINYNPKEWFTFIFQIHKADTFRKLLPLIFAVNVYAGLVAYNKQLKILKEQLISIKRKIESADSKLFDDIINNATYKKWMNKFSSERAILTDEIKYLEEDLEDKMNQELLLLPYLLNLPAIFKEASLNQQHAILNGVFKEGITFKEGAFRTPFVNPNFDDNY